MIAATGGSGPFQSYESCPAGLPIEHANSGIFFLGTEISL